MLSIQFTEEGRETLRNLHIENQRVVKNSIKTLASNPELGKALVGRLKETLNNSTFNQ
jgi:mRNA-degrading endonuclease RelE of RelBE toxin-antitoxin system